MYLKYDTAGVAFRLNLLSFQQGLKHLNFYVGITKQIILISHSLRSVVMP